MQIKHTKTSVNLKFNVGKDTEPAWVANLVSGYFRSPINSIAQYCTFKSGVRATYNTRTGHATCYFKTEADIIAFILALG